MTLIADVIKAVGAPVDFEIFNLSEVVHNSYVIYFSMQMMFFLFY